uniref:Uncharacterized protein n=1 Tax=Glossina palpalis gambiensis TaxID=67801 RepID=A0A1B0C6V8_9MUSC
MEFDFLVKSAICRSSNASVSSALHLVQKKGKNDWQPCSDFRPCSRKQEIHSLDLSQIFKKGSVPQNGT